MTSTRHRPLYATLIVLGWIYSVAHFASTGVQNALKLFGSDFLASFPAWKVAKLCGRLDMYRGSLSEQWGPPPVWHYGPLEHLVTLPLFLFPTLKDAFVFWLFVNYAIAAAIVVMLIRLIDHGRPTFATVSVVIIATLNFNPFYEALTIRAIEMLELLLVLMAYAWYRKGRDTACGVAIGLAAMAKYLPLIFLPYFVVKRRWRALAAALATIVPIAIATQLVLGWENSGTFHQLGDRGIFYFEENQSLSGILLRVLPWTDWRIPGPLVTRIAIAIALAAISALYLRTRSCRTADDLEWWTLASVMILVPPHNQNYYMVFLLPAYLFLFARYRGQDWTWRSGAALLSFLVVGLPVPLSLLSRIAGVPVWPLYLRAGLGFFGAAVLVTVLVAELLDACRPGTSHALEPVPE